MQVNRARCCYRNRGHSYFDGHSVRSGDGGGPADSWCKGPLHLLPRPPCEVYRSTDGCPHHLATGIIWKIIHSFTNIQLDPYYMAKGMVQFIHSQTNKQTNRWLQVQSCPSHSSITSCTCIHPPLNFLFCIVDRCNSFVQKLSLVYLIIKTFHLFVYLAYFN